MIRPSPQVSHAGSSESLAEAYSNSRDPIDDSDSVAEVLDQDSIPDVFKAKKKVRSSHIWLPENGIECVVDGVDRWKCQRCGLHRRIRFLTALTCHV